MQIVRSIEDIAAVTDPELRRLIQLSADQLLSEFDPGYTLEELCRFIVVESGDTGASAITTINEQLGFSILSNRWDGTRWDAFGFTPSWEILEEHAGYFELVYVLGQDGSGVTVFAAKTSADSELLAMCRRYSTPGDQA